MLEQIKEDIKNASTLPGSFYSDRNLFELSKAKIFANSWQFIDNALTTEASENLLPFSFLSDFMDIPLVLSRNEKGMEQVFSNVCTHRGNVLVGEACKMHEIRCRYHGRRFDLDGKFKFMPETKGMEDFPSEHDDLPQVPLFKWKGLPFCSVFPETDLMNWLDGMEQRVGWMPIEQFLHDPTRDTSYRVKAHWALYCDNFLEGFHIPFVHPELNQTLDYGQYETTLLKHGVLQTGFARDGEQAFILPENSPDFGRNIAAWYFWFFPNIMFNFYPWGLSLNIVLPIDHENCEVRFRSFVWKPELLDQGAGADLNTVELQDEEVVEQVQRGVKSPLYNRGRFSPRMEQGVHHFHRMLAESMRV